MPQKLVIIFVKFSLLGDLGKFQTSECIKLLHLVIKSMQNTSPSSIKLSIKILNMCKYNILELWHTV